MLASQYNLRTAVGRARLVLQAASAARATDKVTDNGLISA